MSSCWNIVFLFDIHETTGFLLSQKYTIDVFATWHDSAQTSVFFRRSHGWHRVTLTSTNVELM